MTAQAPEEKADTSSKSTENELPQHAISRVSTDQFQYENCKDTDLKHTVDKAKRDLKAGKT